MATNTKTAGNSMQSGQIAPLSKLWRAGLLAAVGATTINLLIFWIGKAVFEIPFLIPFGGPSGPLRPLPVAIIIIFIIVPAIGATLLLALLGKFLNRPIRAFWIISVIAFAISFLLPLSLPEGVASSTKISLSLMHIPAGALIVGLLTKSSRLGSRKGT